MGIHIASAKRFLASAQVSQMLNQTINLPSAVNQTGAIEQIAFTSTTSAQQRWQFNNIPQTYSAIIFTTAMYNQASGGFFYVNGDYDLTALGSNGAKDNLYDSTRTNLTNTGGSSYQQTFHGSASILDDGGTSYNPVGSVFAPLAHYGVIYNYQGIKVAPSGYAHSIAQQSGSAGLTNYTVWSRHNAGKLTSLDFIFGSGTKGSIALYGVL
jgi:hypothetical protein